MPVDKRVGDFVGREELVGQRAKLLCVPGDASEIKPLRHALNVAIESDDAASRVGRAASAQAFVDAVTKDKAAVKGADAGLVGGDELAIEVDQHARG